MLKLVHPRFGQTQATAVPTTLSTNKPLVIIESPFAAKTPEETQANILYARAALRDSLLRGEAPIASHLLYTQPGVLDDNIPAERQLGIDAGLAWRRVADKTVVYAARGISRGMQYGIEAAKTAGKPVEYRDIPTAAFSGNHLNRLA